MPMDELTQLTSTSHRPNHLFVVRLWREPQALTPGPWRGSVEHIPTGQRLYFVSLIDLADFIGLRLGADPDNEKFTGPSFGMGPD
jgi:hypothetical protein